MYLYFDKNGILKEIINDEALRQGSSGVNKVYAFFEGDRIINGVYFNILRNGDLTPIRHAYTSLSVSQVPYDSTRTLKYFKYFVNYNFYTYTLDSTDLAIEGLLKMTVQAYDSYGAVFALGLVLLTVEDSAVAITSEITISEYQDLLNAVANCPTWTALETYIGLSRAFLQGLSLPDVRNYIDLYHVAGVMNNMLTGVLTTTVELSSGIDFSGSIDLSNYFYLKGLTYSKVEADALFVSTANAYTKSEVDTLLNNKASVGQLNAEAGARASADSNLQSQIDTIEAGKNVADIVGTYAQLLAYDTTYIQVGDIIQVMSDEDQGGSTSNYRLASKSPVTWTLIGSEAPTYTKTESDNKFATIISLNATNIIVGNNTSAISTITTDYATNIALAATNQNVSDNTSEIVSIKANYATTASLSAVATSGSYNDLTNKPTIPTDVGDLTNNVGYITATNYAGETVGGVIIASSLGGSETDLVEVKINTTTHKLYAPMIPTLDIEVVSALPTTGSAGVIYLVPKTGTTTDQYDEWVWVNGAWEQLGGIDIDLSGYLTSAVAEATYQHIFSGANKLSVAYISGLATVATSGSYADLTNKPTIINNFLVNGSVNETGEITFTGLVIADLITAIQNNALITFVPTNTALHDIILTLSKEDNTNLVYMLSGSYATNGTEITNYDCKINIASGVATGTYTIKQTVSGASVASADYASSNTQLNGLSINGTNYKLLDVKVNDGSSLVIGKNRSLKSGADSAVAIGDCDSAMVSGSSSTALGCNSTANTSNSTAIGYGSTASGGSSIALGNYSVASGGSSIALGRLSKASGDSSTALGHQAAVCVPNWVGFDGTSNALVRTVSLKSTDNVFFRNENVNASKTTQASYTSGKTLTQVLSEKQDTLVSGTNIKTIGGVSVLGSGDIPAATSGYKQTFNVSGSEWGNCYKGLNEMLKEDDMGKPADTYVAPTITEFKSWQLNGIDVAYPKQITGANSYSARFESRSIASDIANLSWDDIIALAEIKAFDSTNLGQTKQLDIGGVAYTVQIVGVNHDDLTDGTGKANLTFELKYLLATTYAMNPTDTNSGGWEATAMRTNVLPNILSQMPTNIQNAIKSVNKANCKVYNSATITYTSDKLFLLSAAELLGVKSKAPALEGTQYEYWANNNTESARIKYQGEGGATANDWWLRSPDSNDSGRFCFVGNDGGVYPGFASHTYGVSFAFDL